MRELKLLIRLTLVALVGGLVSSSAISAVVDMGWTPGGNTTTISDGALTSDMGTINTSGTTASSMSAVFTTNPNDAEVGALWLDGNPVGGPMVSQTIQLAYNITVNAQPATATGQPKFLNESLMGGPASAGTAGILLGMNIAATVPNGPWAFRFALAPTDANGGVFAMRSPDNSTLMAFGSYSVGTTYSVVLDADYSSGLLNAYINGTLALSGYQFRPGGQDVSTSEVFIHLNGESGYANSVTVGDLTVTAPVPEPSTFLAGGLLLLPFGIWVVRSSRGREKKAQV